METHLIRITFLRTIYRFASPIDGNAATDSHVPLLVIIAIHHILIHLFKRSKDKEQVHYGIINISLALVFNFSFACLTVNNVGVLQLFMCVGHSNFVAG